jgi:deazaflavin-dependent oxidoreductase (nitroreductase family)
VTDELGRELAGWGKVALIGTRGRVSGGDVVTAVGFVEDADGSLLVAAGAEQADWALNLRNDPRCSVTIGTRRAPYAATELFDADRNRAIIELVLKYGTPAERLGRGPAFRLIER